MSTPVTEAPVRTAAPRLLLGLRQVALTGGQVGAVHREAGQQFGDRVLHAVIPTGAALGHPRVFLEIDETGIVECGYCDRRFVLIGGPADQSEAA